MATKAKRGPSTTVKAKAVGGAARGLSSTPKSSAPKTATARTSPTRAAASLVLAGPKSKASAVPSKTNVPSKAASSSSSQQPTSLDLAGPKAKATAAPAKAKVPNQAASVNNVKKTAEEDEATSTANVVAAAEEERQKQQAAAEAEIKRLAELANGEVTVKYSLYAEKFQIANHTLTAQAIDEIYFLSEVMPGCFIHLAEKEFGYGEEQQYVKEDPAGTFRGLMAGTTYWCYVQQDPEQELKDQEAMKRRWAGEVVGGGLGDRGTETEGCSCIYGAPCTDPMICKDFENRFANALKAGGNPILFK